MSKTWRIYISSIFSFQFLACIHGRLEHIGKQNIKATYYDLI